MCAAKRKKRLPGKTPSRGKARVAPATASRQEAGQAWSLSFESCIGWLACLIIIISPLVFKAHIRNFSDLPQRTVVQAAVAMFCTLGVLRAALQRIRLELPRDFCTCMLALFACWALASCVWSTSSYDAFYAASHWSTCVLAAVGLAAWMQTDMWLKRFAAAVVVSGAVVSAVALAQQFGGMTRIPVVKIPSAAFGNPNVLAEFLSCTIAFSVWMGWYVRRRLPWVLVCWLVSAAGIVLLYFTRCRSAWLAIGCLALWSIILFVKRIAGWKVLVPAGAVLVCAVVFAGVNFASQAKLGRQFDGSANYRLIVWNNSRELVKQQPVLGFGAGSFPNVYPSVINARQADKFFGKDIQIRRAHNDFLQSAAELGLPGFFLLVFFSGGVLIMTLLLVNKQRPELEQCVLFAASGSFVTFLVNASFGFPFQRAVTPLLFFMSAAMIITLYCRQRRAFFSLSHKGTLVTIALGCAVAGALMLRFNLGTIESDAYYKRALAMEKRRKNDRALAYGLRAMAARPQRMDVLTTVGRAYITTGKLDKGIDALQTVTAMQPHNLNALFILGVGYANAGRSAEALDAFRRVLEIKPDFNQARLIVSRLKSRGRVKVNLK